MEQDLNLLPLSTFYEYKNLLPISYHEDTSVGEKIAHDHTTTHPAYSNSYCNVTVESECEEYPYSKNINLAMVSEKTWKPFIARQIPMLVGGRGHLAYLRNLGFETMEDLMPPGYDSMPFLQKVDAVVSTVAKGKEFIKDFYFSHIKEIKHNYELIMSNQVEQLIANRINRLIT
jgi:hypothetical protein